jgi:Ca-activated chloride channel family protein
MNARLVGVVLLALAGAALAAAPQQPAPQTPPVFRGGTETVAIYVTVLNRAGEMILDLDRDDFTVFDEGRPQELSIFNKGLQPITAAVLVDTSASMTLNLDLAQNAAEQFVIRMLPGDQARVGSFSDRVDLSPAFTSDRDALLQALRTGLHIGNPTKLWDAVDETMTALGPLGGRRIIMLLTDGIDTASTTTVETVLTRSRSDELMVYAVQFRTTARAQAAEIPLSPTAGALFSGDDARRQRESIATLPRLARQSGGGFFVLNQYDDINATFTQVMHELHYQYVLGFTPQRADGRIHDLTVRINRPNVTIRARQSYLAPKAP